MDASSEIVIELLAFDVVSQLNILLEHLLDVWVVVHDFEGLIYQVAPVSDIHLVDCDRVHHVRQDKRLAQLRQVCGNID